MGAETPKQLLTIAGKTVLAHTLAAFEQAGSVDQVVLVAPADAVDRFRSEADSAEAAKVVAVVPGGAERQHSVQAGLKAVADATDVVAIHDAVRPLIRPGDIDAVVNAASKSGAAVLATPVTDTLKQVEAGTVTHTLDRSTLWSVQTPQAFHLAVIRRAHSKAEDEGFTATDDTALVERLGGTPVKIVAGRRDNIKITIPEDLHIAELILQAESGAASKHRTGIGYDVHRLVEGRPLILGGVTIPFERGLLGHSDADVLSHAIVDAILGAVGQGDIGRLYPDTGPEWKDAPSDIFLKGASERLAEKGGKIINIDAVVMAQEPKLAPYIDAMQTSIANALGIAHDQVSVKATTTEGLGFVGAGEGMAAQAVATVLL